MEPRVMRILWFSASVLVIVVLFLYLLPRAIRSYGADSVQAFASVVSLLSLLSVTIATVIYVRRTADIARSTEESSRQQAKLADLMAKDLRFRVEPYLKYIPQAGSASSPHGVIKNEGRGTAVNLRVRFRFVRSGREGDLRVPDLLAPGEPTSVQLIRGENEDAYTIEVRCSDSASLNDYLFEWTNDGSLASWRAEPRART